MTEIVFQKLEEKVMQVLADFENTRKGAQDAKNEIDHLRHEVQRLSQELTSLRQEKDNNAKKLRDLIMLLDAVNNPSDNVMVSPTLLAVKPVLVQG